MYANFIILVIFSTSLRILPDILVSRNKDHLSNQFFQLIPYSLLNEVA